MPERYAIATPHTAATAAGVAAFEAGGNAVDAAIAAACAIAVVYPHMNAVGGDVMALVHDGAAHAVNGSGRAPAGLPPGPVPLRGVGAITVPGAVRAWETLAERFGSLPLSRALLGAAALAHAGVPVAPSLARTAADCADVIAADAGLAGIFAPGGRLLAEGDPLVQPQLGLTLERLAAHGAHDLYAGETGTLLAAGLGALGAPLVLADLEAHRTEVSPALRHRVGDEDILTMGPNSQGFVLAQIMAIAERLGIGDPFWREAPALAAAFAETARERDLHLADPAAMRITAAELLSDDHLAALARRVAAGGEDPPARPRATGDTIALVAADGSGLHVSLIQSIFYGFGSGILEPRTGILLHNRGACFSADPESPNAPAPGKRPLHTLMPLVVERAGRVRWVAGTMGGHAQPQIHAQLLLRRRAGADAQAAVSAPRFIVGDAEPGAAIALEVGLDAAWAAFAGSGAAPVAVPPGSGLTGHSHAIAVRADGSFDAGSDPRADGAAATSG
jgi:gamma-glutamyltranspeptidase